MNLIITVKNAEKPEAQIVLNPGAKALIKRVKDLKIKFPKGVDPRDHMTAAEIGFMVAYGKLQESIVFTHEANKPAKKKKLEVVK